MLFGRYGLPKEFWLGQKFFECPSKAHPDIQTQLENFYETEVQRIQKEAEEAMIAETCSA